MNIDWIELSRVIPYAGVAILVIAVVVYLLDRQDKRDKQSDELRTQREVGREKARREEVERVEQVRKLDQERQDRKDAERDQRYLTSMAERDIRFTTSFANLAKDWREAYEATISKQAELSSSVGREMERLAALVSLTNVLLERHDQWERAIWEGQRSRRTGDTGPLTPPGK